MKVTARELNDKFKHNSRDNASQVYNVLSFMDATTGPYMAVIKRTEPSRTVHYNIHSVLSDSKQSYSVLQSGY